MSKKFWNFARDENGARTLYLLGAIAEEPWLEDDVTPKAFRDELFAGTGEVTLYIHSPGGDVFAASQIYTMLMEYPGSVTVKIEGLAASAASVIAMAGGEVLMSPVSMLMIHNPATIAIGDSEEMLKAIEMLAAVKESIITAYEIKTGLSHTRIGKMMAAESWLYAEDAIRLGFADGLIEGTAVNCCVNCGSHSFTHDLLRKSLPMPASDGHIFSRAAVTNSLLGKMKPNTPSVDANALFTRLSLIIH